MKARGASRPAAPNSPDRARQGSRSWSEAALWASTGRRDRSRADEGDPRGVVEDAGARSAPVDAELAELGRPEPASFVNSAGWIACFRYPDGRS
jgi:hypothetical protein